MNDSILQEKVKRVIMEDFQTRSDNVDTKFLSQGRMCKIISSLYNDDEDIKGLIKEAYEKKRAKKEAYEKKWNEKMKKFPEEMRKKSIKNYSNFYDMDENEVNIMDVFFSSAGIRGWAEDYGEGVIV